MDIFSSKNDYVLPVALTIGAGLSLYWVQRVLTSYQRYQYLCNLSTNNNSTRSSLLESAWLPSRSMLVLNQIVDAFIPAESEEDLEEDGFFMIDRSFESLWPSLMDHQEIFESLSPAMEKKNVRSFLLSGAKELGVAVTAAEAMGKLLLQEDKDKISLLLKTLGTYVGTFVLTGYPISFQCLPLEDRVLVLRSLRGSYVPQLRAAYQALRRLTGSIFASYGFHDCKESPSGKNNPAWAAMGYDIGETISKPQKIDLHHEGNGDDRKMDKSRVPLPTPIIVPTADRSQAQDQNGFDVYETDVVVVGSGAGGGTIAAQLVKEGHRVIILEKGDYYRAKDFASWSEAEAFEAMYERGGFCTTKDGNIVVLAGATVGGGTTVNWSASFITPDYVRREWASEGMECFEDGSEFENSLDEAMDMYQVNTEYVHTNDNGDDIEDLIDDRNGYENVASSKLYNMKISAGNGDGDVSIGYHLSLDTQSQDQHDNDSRILSSPTSSIKTSRGSDGDKSSSFIKNINNEILIKGAYSQDKYPEIIARNAVGCVDCGACSHGCPYKAKQSTIHSQLEPLASSGKLFLIPNCHVDRVLIDGKFKEARGIEGVIYEDKDDKKGKKKNIKVNAKVVISSCGSIHTPALLLRSGLQNEHIGRHLALHPVAGVAGIFDVDTLQSFYGRQHAPSANLCSTGLGSGISMGIVVRSDLDEREKASKKKRTNNSQYKSSSGHGAKYGSRELPADQSRERSHGIFTTTPAIETPPIHPGILGMVMNWDNGLAFKTSFLWYKQIAAFIGIPRDLSSYYNRVTLSSEGQPVLNYTLTKKDEVTVMKGIELMMKMMRGAGAAIQFPIHENRQWIDLTKLDDEAFEQVLDKLKSEGIQKHKMSIFSAHQMRYQYHLFLKYPHKSFLQP